MIHPDHVFAYIIHQELLYLAQMPQSKERHSPFTALTSLIQGIYQTHPQEAHTIIRNRIYTNQNQATALSYGMVKVAAKRITYGAPSPTQPQTQPPPFTRVIHSEWKSPFQLEAHFEGLLHREFSFLNPQAQVVDEHLSDQKWMEFTNALLTPSLSASSLRIPSWGSAPQTPAYTQDRSIAALLVGPHPEHGREVILGVGFNTQSLNRTLHAEVNLVQNYHQRTGTGLPAYSKIFTTLKPCRMCAGMIWESAQDLQTLKVFYSKDDPGVHACQTVLDFDSDDRRRFKMSGIPDRSEILFPLLSDVLTD